MPSARRSAGRDRLRQVSRVATPLSRARRDTAPGVLPRRARDAGTRPRQTLAALATLENRAGIEARGTADALRGQPPLVQSVRVARTTRSLWTYTTRTRV